MIYTIKNNYLNVEISSNGAEIKKIVYNNIDYLHNSDPKYWGRSAPLLWPNIGTIKNDKAMINGTEYPMKKHGFLRDTECELYLQKEDSITFKASSNDETLKLYPFNFTILITYKLVENKIISTLKFTNYSKEAMPFNLGLHPAFKVPLYEDEKFEDYQIIFGKTGTYEMPVVNLNDGTIDFMQRNKSFVNMDTLPLNYPDYDNDALIFENINTKVVTLKHKNKNQGVIFDFEDFPMLGIWTPFNTKAPFICLEPWIGCADTPTTDGDFTKKRDLIWLEQNQSKEIKYELTFF